MSTKDRKLRVFLCHASEDRATVRELYQRLIAEGWIEPWLDTAKILPGQHWTTVIKESINSADSVIILISNNSLNKEGFVQREMNYVWEKSLEKPRGVIFLIPLRLENCVVPYDFSDRQWADLFGEEKEDTYQALLKSLKIRYEQTFTHVETKQFDKKQEEDKLNRVKEELERKDAEEKSKRNIEEKQLRYVKSLTYPKHEEKKHQAKKEYKSRATEDDNYQDALLARERAIKKTIQETEVIFPLPPTEYSINDFTVPKKNNTTIIIGTVTIVILLCCCISAGLIWQYGDPILQQLGIY